MSEEQEQDENGTPVERRKRRRADFRHRTRNIIWTSAGALTTAFLLWTAANAWAGAAFLRSLTHRVPQAERNIEELQEWRLAQEQKDEARHIELMRKLDEIHRQKKGGK